MTIAPGSWLGPYEVLAALGAGGMGEVYRALDHRLDRVVALKILPTGVAGDPDRLRRFEEEARAVARLSHPNILTLHDVGASGDVSYVVMELLEGETLRERLRSGPLPPRKAADIAAQAARGLAAAHERQIVHRDVKPENLFITADGHVKVLDFGLARRTDGVRAEAGADTPTLMPGTEPGVVLGTVGYMAPEQVRGERVDHRADIFALGVVLYEMLCGRPPFTADTAAETMTAILRQDPPDPAELGVTVAPSLLRIVRRALEKRPEERFQSARDLGFALESPFDSGSAVRPKPHEATRVRAGSWRTAGMVAAGVVLGAVLVALFARPWPASSARAALAPSFRQLTFERGFVKDARFTPDGHSVVYTAAWEGQPLRIFMTRTDAVESVRLQLPDARLLSISRSGELAVSLGHRNEGWIGAGTLARSSLLGAAPRILAERVREAEWNSAGDSLAIVRRADGLEQLEFPIGRPLYRTAGFISDVRFSPDGRLIAFADHPVFADDAGGVSVVSLDGERTPLATGFTSIRGLAWSPDGREVWFVGHAAGEYQSFALNAVTLERALRTIWSAPGPLRLLDLAPDGRVLLAHEGPDRRIDAQLAGVSAPVDMTLRANSMSQWISSDGSTITIADQSTPHYSTYLLRSGSPPVRLGDGHALGVSPDGKLVMAVLASGTPIVIHPTGAGETRELPNPDQLLFDVAAWLPDSRRIVAIGHTVDHPTRAYIQDIDGGAPRPLTPEGVRAQRWWSLPVSPDGTRFLALDPDGAPALFSTADGSAEPVRGMSEDEVCTGWTADGRALLVASGGGAPWVIERLDLDSGRRTRIREIRAREAAGLRLSILATTPDARSYVHSYARVLSALYVVEGLR